jgi:hypothetical protein
MSEKRFKMTFPLGKYEVQQTDEKILGLCDVPADMASSGLGMLVPGTGNKTALQVAVHELGHACGIPESVWHKLDDSGKDVSDYIGAALWKLGWRQVEE